MTTRKKVVYLLIPTSNHNLPFKYSLFLQVVYLLIPTSNHNSRVWEYLSSTLYIFWFLHQTTTYKFRTASGELLYIFWFLHQTTTEKSTRKFGGELYIFWFLHQTTTFCNKTLKLICCISFDSYIKPQLKRYCYKTRPVVYLLIPTSNHNPSWRMTVVSTLYIFWFLHQTTTRKSGTV